VPSSTSVPRVTPQTTTAGDSSKNEGRLVSTGESVSEFQSPLAPLILLRKTESPPPFQECLAIIYKDEFDEIVYESALIYALDIFSNLNTDKEFTLDFDEFLGIYFYTLEWQTRELNLYSRLNQVLSSSDRSSSLSSWKFYLHYLMNGLRKIPLWKSSQDLYRGVPGDLIKIYPEKYKVEKIITWYGFSSTSTNLARVQSFLGDNEATIFCINECISGRRIEKFSAHPEEAEILLPPGSRFKIVGIIRGKITLIQLKQIPTLEKLLKLE